ncbi:MAG TPA: hypothetical protein VF541_03100 [Longimicrobium sp.]|jgi:hypothetical protein
MSIRRPLIFVAASVGLLGAAAGCSGNSPTAVGTTDIANPPVRDTSGFIPPASGPTMSP